MTGDRVDYASSQEAAGRFPEIPPEATTESVILIGTDGVAMSGAEAVLEALAAAPRWGWARALYRRMPGVAPLTESAYRLVARRRRFFSRATRTLWGASVEVPAYRLSRCLFLRLVGAIYLVAFLSLWVQVDGLLGSDGILPASSYLHDALERLGPRAYRVLPTLCWLDSSDATLGLMCAAGAALSVLMILGVLPSVCAASMWILYLSLTVAGQTFLSFQWDILLLEAGFLSIFLSPLRWRCRMGCPSPPSRMSVALIQWLLFRLMFSSGLTKLTWGDPTWWNLSALDFHYQTQPLPTWTAWWAHQAPGWLDRASVLVMFAIELGAPFGLLAPRRVRHAAAAALLAFQAAIAATGNYGFFNLISAALVLFMLDDTAYPRRWRARLGGPGVAARRRWPRLLLAPLAALLFLVGAVHLIAAFRFSPTYPRPVRALLEWTAPLHLSNGYGLFRVMTTTRLEIVVEGSRDGAEWLPYEFRWKPGDPRRAPAFVQPHMPRLDWQMWFAALSDFRSTPWFQRFVLKLLEGSPSVLSLLERNPFPDSPPRYIRAVAYEYHFTGLAEQREQGAWWLRDGRRDYAPTLSLKAR